MASPFLTGFGGIAMNLENMRALGESLIASKLTGVDRRQCGIAARHPGAGDALGLEVGDCGRGGVHRSDEQLECAVTYLLPRAIPKARAYFITI